MPLHNKLGYYDNAYGYSSVVLNHAELFVLYTHNKYLLLDNIRGN